MPDYYEYMTRHGEFGVQAIIEQIERCEGIVANTNIPLEKRWAALMFQPTPSDPQPMIAYAR